MLGRDRVAIRLRNGHKVRIRRRWRSPYAERSGMICAVELNDPYGAYLVHFDDGIQFRYRQHELDQLMAPSPYFYERAIRLLIEFTRSLFSS
jgi:hypothetical protein